MSAVSAPTFSHYYYPGASTQGGRDGLLVQISPENAKPWLGTFAFGDVTSNGVSGLFTTPAPDLLCIVSRGDGYIVNASMPTMWETVRAMPVMDVRPIGAHGIIVFANFTELVAYGATGIKWRTKRLAWDGLKITEVSDGFIKGEFWDIRSEGMASFVVDLENGTHEGGASEE